MRSARSCAQSAAEMSAAIDRDNPWPGLASYDEAAQAWFSGRDAEIVELVRRIADEPVTVLFGKSGLGKSSLLKAGVFPVLRQRGLLPVPLRLLFGADAIDPMEQLAGALFSAFTAESIDHPPRVDGEPLWDYLHRDGLRFWTPKVRPVQPVFVLDQFEEVFTLGRRAGGGVVDALRDRLADLAENRIPAQLAERAERGESLALDVHAQPYKIVLSLREDFLPDLEGWMQALPSLRRNRMRLTPLQRREALQAVHNERTAHLVDAALASRIIDYLAGATDGDAAPVVEPALLSLVCRGINEARKRDGKECFDEAMFEAGKGRIVADFYRESLADQPPRVARFIEDELVTEQGFRNSYSVLAAVERGLVRREEIAALVDRRLLRLEHHLGAERVELTHDLLTRAVLEGRSRRVAHEAERQHRRRLWRYGLAALVIVALVGVLYSLQVSGERQRLARSRELAAISGNELSGDPQLAIALAAEGLRSADSTEARNALLTALRGSWPSADLDSDRLGGTGRALAIAPDGSRLAVLSGNGLLSLWDIEQLVPRQLWGGAKKVIELSDDDVTPGLTFDADGASVFVAALGAVHRFEVAGAGAKHELPLRDPRDRDPPELDPSERVDTLVASQLAVSRNGHWLAAVFSGGRLLMRQLDAESAHWVEVKVRTAEGHDEVPGFELVALSDDGSRIVGARDNPLGALQLKPAEGGHWTSAPIEPGDECRRPQSVSMAPNYVAWTWDASACAVPLTGDKSLAQKKIDRAIGDSIASSLGGAYVAIKSPDLQVGVGGPAAGGPARTLRGLGGDPPGNMSGLFAIDEKASRVAMLGEHGAVRVIYVGSERLLLVDAPELVSAVTGDGRWFAQAPRVQAEGEPGADLRLYALDQAFIVDELPRVQHRIALPAPVLEIHATRGRLLVTIATDPMRTLVIDAARGQVVGAPIEGQVRELGSAAELLVVPAGQDTQGRRLSTIVRRSDDQTLAPWVGAQAALIQLSRNRNRHLSAALVRSPGEAGTLRADVYRVRSGDLQRVGQLSGIPYNKDSSFELSDDGRVVHEWRLVTPRAAQQGQRPRPLDWAVQDGEVVDVRRVEGSAPTEEVSDDDGAAMRVIERGPNGRFELLRANDRELLARAGTHDTVFEFSPSAVMQTFDSDERLLAYVDAGEDERDPALHLYDLQERRPWLELPWFAYHVGFEGGGALLQADSQLIPLDTPLLLNFARWHVQRPLPDEKCRQYRLEASYWCRRPAAAPASR